MNEKRLYAILREAGEGKRYDRLAVERAIEKAEKHRLVWSIGRWAVVAVVLISILGAWGCPNYNVWQKGLAGQAKLREAEQSRQIAIEEAKAREQSAHHDNEATITRAEGMAEAEIIRARGVAEANRIIAEGLGGAQGYLRYLWIDKLGESDVIYADRGQLADPGGRKAMTLKGIEILSGPEKPILGKLKAGTFVVMEGELYMILKDGRSPAKSATAARIRDGQVMDFTFERTAYTLVREVTMQARV